MQSEKARWVPVVSKTGKPLMPCHPARARKLVARGKAIKQFKHQFFYIQLTEREDGDIQEVAVGIDPGSMREAYTVMSAKRTFVNLQTHAANGKGIKKSMEGRAAARRARRGRHTPCRVPRFSNRSCKNWLPPSTRARWQRKLNLVLFLSQLYPIDHIAIEDVSMEMKKGEKRRNAGFSPIQAGKHWLYKRLETLGYTVSKYLGVETASFRKQLGLAKTKDKLASVFAAHCVDSWVLANAVTGGRIKPDLTSIVELVHHHFTRRQLHKFNPIKGGERTRSGGTLSLGIRKGTLCTWKDSGLYFVGGNNGRDRLSLHSASHGVRVTQKAKMEDIHLIAYCPWRYQDHGVCPKSKLSKRGDRMRKLSKVLHGLGIRRPRIDETLRSGLHQSFPQYPRRYPRSPLS